MSVRCVENFTGFSAFLDDAGVQALRWPDDVIEQLLFDHAANGAFQVDYGHINLNSVIWSRELVPIYQFLTMPTGSSDGDAIECWAEVHDYAVTNREKASRMAENSPTPVSGRRGRTRARDCERPSSWTRG